MRHLNHRNRCPNCEKMFSSHRADAKCCSAKCRKAIQRKRDKENVAPGAKCDMGTCHSYDQEANDGALPGRKCDAQMITPLY